MKTKNTIAFALLFSAVPLFGVAQNSSNATAPADKPASEIPYNLLGGPGIVTSVSATQNQLPAEAQKFLQTYYSRVMVGYINHNVVKDEYNVELGNGVKITFNAKGQVDDIQSPGTDSLYLPAIKAVLPEKAYKHLEQAGLLYDVTGIKNAKGKGLRVQLLNAMPPEMLFDVDGLFIIVDD